MIDFLRFLSAFSVAGVCLTYLFKKLGEDYLKRRFSAYETELNLLFHRKSKMHEKRLQVIRKLYKKIAVLDIAFKEMTAIWKQIGHNPDAEEQVRVDKASSAYNDFVSFYTRIKSCLSHKSLHPLTA